MLDIFLSVTSDAAGDILLSMYFSGVVIVLQTGFGSEVFECGLFAFSFVSSTLFGKLYQEIDMQFCFQINFCARAHAL